MPIEKYNEYDSPYYYRYCCDDCKKITIGYEDIEFLKDGYPEWLKFWNGHTYCPECLKRRSVGRLIFSWGKFVRVRQELEKETGINNKAVIYRLWQLRGVFSDMKYVDHDVNEIDHGYVFFEEAIIHGNIRIYNDGEVNFNFYCKSRNVHDFIKVG